jgi:NitT/TauT family transport system ATP-binding protein
MPWKSVIGNVELALEFARIPKRDRHARAERYIDLVGLSDFSNHYPAELSGGMQQRVGIARALAVEPQVLLMDEPFGALDAITRGHMQTEVLDIWEREKKTVLFVTHSIDEAILLSDRVLVMKDGQVHDEVVVPIERPRSREDLLVHPDAIDLKRKLVRML